MLDLIGFVIAIIIAVVGYRYTMKKQKHRTLDGHILKKLEDSGIDINEEQALEFWFYGKDKQSAEQLADQLRQCDYEAEVTETEGDPEYIIRVFKTMIPELSVMLDLRREFNILAKANGVVYDNWGCRALPGNNNE